MDRGNGEIVAFVVGNGWRSIPPPLIRPQPFLSILLCRFIYLRYSLLIAPLKTPPARIPPNLAFPSSAMRVLPVILFPIY